MEKKFLNFFFHFQIFIIIRTLVGSQDVKGSKIVLESARQYFLSDFLMTLKENQLEKFCLSSI